MQCRTLQIQPVVYLRADLQWIAAILNAWTKGWRFHIVFMVFTAIVRITCIVKIIVARPTRGGNGMQAPWCHVRRGLPASNARRAYLGRIQTPPGPPHAPFARGVSTPWKRETVRDLGVAARVRADTLQRLMPQSFVKPASPANMQTIAVPRQIVLRALQGSTPNSQEARLVPRVLRVTTQIPRAPFSVGRVYQGSLRSAREAQHVKSARRLASHAKTGN